MTKTGVTHVNTAKGEGGGRLSETDNLKGKTPAPGSGQHYEREDDKDHGSGKSQKGTGGGD